MTENEQPVVGPIETPTAVVETKPLPKIFPLKNKNGYRTCQFSGALFPVHSSQQAKLVTMKASSSQLKAQQDEHANDLVTLRSEVDTLKNEVAKLQHDVLTLMQKQGGLS